MIHIDSSADWNSTFELVTAAFEFREELAVFRTGIEDAPDLPIAQGWHQLACVQRLLFKIQASISILQPTRARAAQVVPVIVDLKGSLQRMHDGAEL